MNIFRKMILKKLEKRLLEEFKHKDVKEIDEKNMDDYDRYLNSYLESEAQEFLLNYLVKLLQLAALDLSYETIISLIKLKITTDPYKMENMLNLNKMMMLKDILKNMIKSYFFVDKQIKQLYYCVS